MCICIWCKEKKRRFLRKRINHKLSINLKIDNVTLYIALHITKLGDTAIYVVIVVARQIVTLDATHLSDICIFLFLIVVHLCWSHHTNSSIVRS